MKLYSQVIGYKPTFRQRLAAIIGKPIRFHLSFYFKSTGNEPRAVLEAPQLLSEM